MAKRNLTEQILICILTIGAVILMIAVLLFIFTPVETKLEKHDQEIARIEQQRDSLRRKLAREQQLVDMLARRLAEYEHQRQQAAARLDSLLDTTAADDLRGHLRFFTRYPEDGQRSEAEPDADPD